MRERDLTGAKDLLVRIARESGDGAGPAAVPAVPVVSREVRNLLTSIARDLAPGGAGMPAVTPRALLPAATVGDDAPASTGRLVARDVRDQRIEVAAQNALIRMSKSVVNGLFAHEMLDAVKSGALAGIYKEDLRAPALRAKALGTWWGTLIPKGEDGALLLDPQDLPGGAPMIIYRVKASTEPEHLDPALLKAWAAFKVLARARADAGAGLAKCPADLSAQPDRAAIPDVVPAICVRSASLPACDPDAFCRTHRPIKGTKNEGHVDPLSRDPDKPVGQIFFATASAELNESDLGVLGELVEAYKKVLPEHEKRGSTLAFRYVGVADSRAYEADNVTLSHDRACVVARVVDRELCAFKSYSRTIEGRGVDQSSKGPSTNEAALAPFRRVDIFAPPAVPPLVALTLKMLKDGRGAVPLRNRRFRLQVDGVSTPDGTIEGTTDTGGTVNAKVPSTATGGTLTFLGAAPDGTETELWKVALAFAPLPAATTLAGVQARLSNIGLFPGNQAGRFDAETSRAILRFQEMVGMPLTGVKLRAGGLDVTDAGTAATVRALVKYYGS